jgi:large subunit ribosomal protein L17
MRHNRDHRKLNRTASHRKAMLRNMVTSLFESERIITTVAKAKETKRFAERMITFARRGDLSARRHVAKTVHDPKVLGKLFAEIGPRYVNRPGGYTRVVRVGTRKGDAADVAILELLKADEKPRGKKKTPRKTYHKVEIPGDPVEAAKKAKAAADKKAAAKAAKAAKETEEAAAAGTGGEEAGAEGSGETPEEK